MNPKKYDIAFDMDDTLCSLISPCMVYANKVLGRQLKLPAYRQYSGWFPGQLSDDERALLLKEFYTPEFYLNLPSNFAPMHGLSVKKVSEVAKAHYRKVRVITARGLVLGSKAESVTRDWLRKHDFVDADTIEISTPDHIICKTSYCTDFPTVMVDDAVHVAEAFGRDERHKVILIDQVWNSEFPRTRFVTRSSTRRLCEALIANSE